MTQIAALRAVLIAFAAAVLLPACASAPAGKSDFDASHDFSKYQTFAWLSENPMKVGKSTVQPRESLEPSVMAAIRSTLESKGYRYSDALGSADFLLSFTVGSREKIGPDAYPSMSADQVGRGGWGTAYYGGATGAAYLQGVLAIDVFDAAEKRPVWHGVAGRAISEEDRADMRPVIDEVVSSILTDFPPT